MSVKIIGTCPLGHTCEKVSGEVIERCRWYIEVQGHNHNTGEDVKHWDCAIALMPMLQIETSYQTRGAGAAIESFRNEVVRQTDETIKLLK